LLPGAFCRYRTAGQIPARRSRLLPTSGICWLRHDDPPRRPTDPRHPDRLPEQHERRTLATRQAARRRGHRPPPGTIDAIRVIVVVGILAGVASLVADSERASTRRSAERDNSAQNSPFTFARHRENPPARCRRHRRHRRPTRAHRWLIEQVSTRLTPAFRRPSVNPPLVPQPDHCSALRVQALPKSRAPVLTPVRHNTDDRLPRVRRFSPGRPPCRDSPREIGAGGGFPESASASTTEARPYSGPGHAKATCPPDPWTSPDPSTAITRNPTPAGDHQGQKGTKPICIVTVTKQQFRTFPPSPSHALAAVRKGPRPPAHDWATWPRVLPILDRAAW
jgi:hypothetical protein